MNSPIFILACSPRSGSTWMQRLLTSTGEILIWGESGILFPWGVLWTPNSPEECYDGRRYEEHHKNKDLYAFRERKADMWMAVLNPTLEQAFKAHKLYLQQLFKKAADQEGFDRWGMKETRWGETTIKFLLSSWQNSKIIFLTREFEYSYTSRFKHNATTQRHSRAEDIKEFCSNWVRQHRLALKYKQDSRVTIVKYEDLKNSTEKIEQIINWCGCKNSPDYNQCNRKISYSGWGDEVDLPMEDIALVAPYRKYIDNIVRRLDKTYTGI